MPETTRHSYPPAAMTSTITVYGADWCIDTRRALRHLRRLGAKHRYLNIDEDLDALGAAKTITGGQRRTPIVDLGLGGEPLIEPDNETLTAAVVEADMLSDDSVAAHMDVQNVGDLERTGRVAAGAAIVAVARSVPRSARLPLVALGAGLAVTGVAGWCPVYHWKSRTSLGGPGDRPAEADRRTWLARRHRAPAAEGAEVSR